MFYLFNRYHFVEIDSKEGRKVKRKELVNDGKNKIK
jgi:hypothetical protein